MIRLILGLGLFLFLAFEFLGADHGQKIHEGVVAAAAPAQVHVVKAPVRQVFIPAQPVVQIAPQPELSIGVTEAAAAPVDVEPSMTSPEVQAGLAADAQALGKLMHAPGGANVRSGPGRTFGVVGNLEAGDVVVVVDDTSVAGWVRISLQGDGASGWVAAKLLRE